MDFLIFVTSFMAIVGSISVIGGLAVNTIDQHEDRGMFLSHLLLITWCSVQALVSVALLCLWTSEAGR